MSFPLCDAHNHLHDAWLAPHLPVVLRDLAAAGVTSAVVNGTAEADWPDVARLCAATASLRLLPSFGLHPWEVGQASSGWRNTLRRHLDAHPGAAVGEIGLDRWILDRARPDDPRLIGLRRAPLDEQQEAFAWQLAEAAARNLPATIHCLDAWGPLADVLRHSALPARGFLLHAYGGSLELARDLLPLGAHFSFNAAFLAPRHAARRAVFAALPLERLLVETDAPAFPLPPELRTWSLPERPDGTALNHPATLASACTGLASLHALAPDALATVLAASFHRFFGFSSARPAPSSPP
jgi:TatD DNase family protein